MADQYDRASDIELLMNESARAEQAKRAASEPKLEPTGECQNIFCGEPLEPVNLPNGKIQAPLFCNSKCAQEHARRK